MELHDKLEEKFRLDKNQKKALHKLKLFSVADLLFHFPVRYSHISEIKPINQLVTGEYATIYGKFWSPDIKRGYKSKVLRAEGEVLDETGKIKVFWFNQAYMAKMIHSGEFVEFTGKVMESKRGKYLANPEFKKIDSMPIDAHDSLFNFNKKKQSEVFGFPVYVETRGITSKWFYHTILKIIKDKTLDKIEDYIPKEILEKYHLPKLKTALFWIHKPKNAKDAESARKRFAFEEVFCIQLGRQHDKFEYRKNKSFQIKQSKKDTGEFLKRFPFNPTNAQRKSIETILSDMTKDFPMSRLLEGDVGSGKTAVAATASYAVVNQKKDSGLRECLQVAYMAPTEILATQHFESFIKYFEHLPINIGLITGSGCRKFPSKTQVYGPARGGVNWTNISRSQLLKWTINGEISILIGTHALIQKTVKFKKLALVVIDEQHRFGTMQRRKLVRKDTKGITSAPHLLSMTATPIPRTLALTIYGDLDLSLLDEMPKGRKQIITEIIPPDKRIETYQKIRQELKSGRQLYIICPRIFEASEEPSVAERTLRRSDGDEERKFSEENFRGESGNTRLGALEMKAVTSEAKRLKKEVFYEYEIGVLHSKMSKEKKVKTMQEFTEGKINILCATSVVEVGVNVQNATVIIIEGAERFGLAQLHQLRGRVIRSSHQAYCYIFVTDKSRPSSASATDGQGKTIARLKALKTAKNGFELAELDLTLRGAGELRGTKQWGITDLGMEAIKNIKMVEAARTEAIRLIEENPELSNYPLLKQKVHQKESVFHFE